MGVTKRKTMVEPTVPKLSKKELEEVAETRLLNFLDSLHQEVGLPPEMKEELLSHSQDIYEESRQNAEKRIEFAEERGVLPTKGEKIAIWQNEFRKSMLEQIEKLVNPTAQKRVDEIIASLPPKDRAIMEAQRDEYVKQMQRQLALNPKFLKERPNSTDQKKQMLAMISALEKQMAALSKELTILKKNKAE